MDAVITGENTDNNINNTGVSDAQEEPESKPKSNDDNYNMAKST